MIKAVVFDLDDTLISEMQYIMSGFYHVAKNIKKEFSINEDVFQLLCEEFNINSKNVFNRVLEKLDLEYSEDNIKRLIYEYRNHCPNIALYEDAQCVLDILKSRGFRLGLITDGYRETQNKKIEVLNIKEIFNSIIVTDELGEEYWKPHKLPYIKSSEELSVDFNEMLYVGDNINKDFIIAKELGINTLQIVKEEGIYHKVQADLNYQADFKIYSLLEILKYVK